MNFFFQIYYIAWLWNCIKQAILFLTAGARLCFEVPCSPSAMGMQSCIPNVLTEDNKEFNLDLAVVPYLCNWSL